MVGKVTKQGAIAQLVARYIRIVEVRGSTPLSSTTFSLGEPGRPIIRMVNGLFVLEIKIADLA